MLAKQDIDDVITMISQVKNKQTHPRITRGRKKFCPTCMKAGQEVEMIANSNKTVFTCPSCGWKKLSLKGVYEKINMPYEDKIREIKRHIEAFINIHEASCALACSFGKASLSLLHLTREVYPEIPVVFSNTLCQYPGVHKVKKQLVNDWDLNFTEVRPKTIKIEERKVQATFWTCAEKYGFPNFKIEYEKREDGLRKPKKGQRRPRCCYHLKEKPALLHYRENRINAVMLGLQAEENWNRKMKAAQYSYFEPSLENFTCYYFGSEDKSWKFQPIIFLTNEDIWRYIKNYEIPYPLEYNQMATFRPFLKCRLGCRFCTANPAWRQEIRIMSSRTYPIIIKKLKKSKVPLKALQTKLGEFMS